MGIHNMNRTRLKLTLMGTAVLLAFGIFTGYIINKASKTFIYDINAPWVALGTIVTTMGAVIGYFVKKESDRPSLLTSNINFNPSDMGPKILPGEDESDPDKIPL